MNPPPADSEGRDAYGELAALIAEIHATPPRCGTVRVVAIDGGAASGKSTLADEIADSLIDVATVHCDDLLDGWSDQFGFWLRLREQVLHRFADGRPARYRRYEWIAREFGEVVEVGVPGFLIVEGVSAIAACAEYASVRILLDVPRAERERRWELRDGELPPQAKRWLDNEDHFFTNWEPDERVKKLDRAWPC